jgi:nucleoid-associated protein YgaU
MITRYIVKSPERWDSVAFKAYGDPFKVPVLASANPTVALDTVLAPGTVLNVPVLPDPEANRNLLPPWKR